jgi:four helix bundle protein
MHVMYFMPMRSAAREHSITSLGTGAKGSRGQLRPCTRAFAPRIVNVAETLPKTRAGNHFANQLRRCGTSVGANDRAAFRARRAAAFCSKLGIVEEETDESIFWLEMFDAKLVSKQRPQP